MTNTNTTPTPPLSKWDLHTQLLRNSEYYTPKTPTQNMYKKLKRSQNIHKTIERFARTIHMYEN